MKKFRFVGDTSINEHILEYGRVYEGDLYVKEWAMSVEEAAYMYPEDWEEVTGQDTRIPNQDMPASSMTKFEMAVLNLVCSLHSNKEFMDVEYKTISKIAIDQVTETFKQLENLKK